MKKFILIFLFIPFLGKAQFKIVNTATINLLELRSDTWPINLQRVTKQSDTTYVVNFRTQEYTKDVIMKALVFPNLTQFKYFQKALSALKSGSTGDVAEFKDYTIKRVDIKKIFDTLRRISTSAPVERLFSQASLCTSDRRNRTNPALINTKLIVHMNKAFIEDENEK